MKSTLQYALGLFIISSLFFSCAPKVKYNESFYSLVDTTIEGKIFEFEQLRGKKVLIVNTASKSILKKQLIALENLWQKNYDKVTVIIYPSGEFDEQEFDDKEFEEQEFDDDKDIENYLRLQYKLEYPIMRKSITKKEEGQNIVYRWLTDINKNGTIDQEPTWNFCKYLIDEKGFIIKYYDEYTIPLEIEEDL